MHWEKTMVQSLHRFRRHLAARDDAADLAAAHALTDELAGRTGRPTGNRHSATARASSPSATGKSSAPACAGAGGRGTRRSAWSSSRPHARDGASATA
jgi:hypothetical protein